MPDADAKMELFAITKEIVFIGTNVRNTIFIFKSYSCLYLFNFLSSGPKCKKNEVYDPCGIDKCTESPCNDLTNRPVDCKPKDCSGKCGACRCMKGTCRNKHGKCVKICTYKESN